MTSLISRGIHRHVIKYLAGTVVVILGVLGLPAPVSAKSPVLHPGDYAKSVERLQERLQELKFFPGLVNGYYGPETQTAVWAFQKSQGLAAENKVGVETWKALAAPRQVPPLVPAGQPRRVEIDLNSQLLTAYRRDRPVLISHVSTGGGPYFCRYGYSSSTLTPTGDFRTVKRIRRSTFDPLVTTYETFSFERDPGGDFMSGLIGGLLGIDRPRAPMAPLLPEPPSQRPTSGCVRVPAHIAEWLYRAVAVGEPVHVRFGTEMIDSKT
ncbi:peptidoglycan-binding protein [Streptosporangium sp. NPDC087985]|uniref:L,D-transpeptidase family protein n=1 Tax=Streptosporangium sp. NPDC087985 TaxID=3366196 RepID=UPI00380A5EC7